MFKRHKQKFCLEGGGGSNCCDVLLMGTLVGFFGEKILHVQSQI